MLPSDGDHHARPRRFNAFAEKLAAVATAQLGSGLPEDSLAWPSEGPTDWQ